MRRQRHRRRQPESEQGFRQELLHAKMREEWNRGLQNYLPHRHRGLGRPAWPATWGRPAAADAGQAVQAAAREEAAATDHLRSHPSPDARSIAAPQHPMGTRIRARSMGPPPRGCVRRRRFRPHARSRSAAAGEPGRLRPSQRGGNRQIRGRRREIRPTRARICPPATGVEGEVERR